MKTKLNSFTIITIVVILVSIAGIVGLVVDGNNYIKKNKINKESEISTIIRPQDFGNGVFYFNTHTKYLFPTEETELFGKSISHFIQYNPEWKVNVISPLTSRNQIMGYLVVCEAVK
jgi:hypothetical protein